MRVYIDANPKMACYVTEFGYTLLEELEAGQTNNTAEYEAVLLALRNVSHITEILSDSQLVVNQLNHKWHIKSDKLRKLAVEIWNIAGDGVKFIWIPRKDNLAGKMLR